MSRPSSIDVRVVLSLLAALALSNARAQEPPPPPASTPRGLAGAGLTQAQVDAAIEAGKRFLVARLERHFPKKPPKDAPPPRLGDENVLVVAALSHTDAFERDKALGQRALASLYQEKLGKTYVTSLVVQALAHLGGPVHKDFVADAVQALVEGATKEEGKGGWAYGREVAHGPREVPVPTVDAPDPVIEVSGGSPVQGRSDRKVDAVPAGPQGGDYSNAQFALLGLHSAAAMGVEAPPVAWARGLDFFSKGQLPDGGFGYKPGARSSYGSMTCAGISGIAIALGHQGVARPQDDDRVKRGVAWLASHFTFDSNPGGGEERWLYYYVYGIERVGQLLGTELLGEHEWYPEGARWLVSQQSADGSWHAPKGGDPERDTAFALLFLTRATTPLYGSPGGNGTLRTSLVVPAAPATGLLFVLDASDSMNEKIRDRTKWEIVRDAAKRLVAKLPDGALVGLRVYGHNPSNPARVDERETELLIPVGKLDRDAFNQTVDRVVPKGRTPIAMSFDRCARDLAAAPACRVLLLSDGAETGGGDPVASARALAENPKCLGIDCLAFDIAKDEKARAQLKEVARVGKGRYVESEDPEAMAEFGALTSLDYWLLDDAGKTVHYGKAGEAFSVSEGHYKVRVVVAGATHERGLWVNANRETLVSFYPDRAPKTR